MALTPTLVRDSTITNGSAIFSDETLYTDSEPRGNFAAYLFITQKKLNSETERVTIEAPLSTLGWSVVMSEDSHYTARLALIPTYAHIKATGVTDSLSTRTILYENGKLYKPLESLDLALLQDQSPTVVPGFYEEVLPAINTLEQVGTLVPATQQTFLSAPLDFVWYADTVLKYTQYLRDAIKECNGCDKKFNEKMMELHVLILKLNTAESLKDFRGFQMILESEEDLIKSCSC